MNAHCPHLAGIKGEAHSHTAAEGSSGALCITPSQNYKQAPYSLVPMWRCWGPEYNVKVAHCLGICKWEERVFVILVSYEGLKPLSFLKELH